MSATLTDVMSHHISPDVFFKEIDRSIVLLDLRAEAYFAFDLVGTLMWKALLITNDEAEALEVLRDKFSVDEARLKADLLTFRDRCIEQGFLLDHEPVRQAAPAPRAASRSRCLVLRAWWYLFQTVRSLSIAGLGPLHRTCVGLATATGVLEDEQDLLGRSLAAFSMAENFFLIKSAPKDCLPRSLALFQFLRSVGLPVDHCIGVRPYPLQAHAWVEYRGRVLHDDPSRQADFSTLARISA